MKYLTLIFCVAFFTPRIQAQDESCFQRYAKVFEIRGTENVEDGWHEDVVVTLRKGSFADCFIGKVKVENGIVIPQSIALKFVDDNYETLKRTYKYEIPITIIQGISKTMVSEDEELINVLFVNAVKPKKKAYERAPDPASFFEL